MSNRIAGIIAFGISGAIWTLVAFFACRLPLGHALCFGSIQATLGEILFAVKKENP